MIFDEARQLPEHRQPLFRTIALQPSVAGFSKTSPSPTGRNERHSTVAKMRHVALLKSARDFSSATGGAGFRGNLRELLADPRIQRAFYCWMTTLELCYVAEAVAGPVRRCWMRL